MDSADRQAIERLFARLAEVEGQTPARDAEAETFIRARIEDQPGAPYYMAQTIVAQEQALEAAQQRIEALEAEASQDRGGILGGLFGGGSTVPRAGSRRGTSAAAPTRGGGGGFLAGAAQTAVGVTGGVLLGSAVAGMLGGEAEASETDAGAEDPGMDDGFDGLDL